ncbi:MAG TPA: serine/threonine-protein kinase [Nocardioides sp.]|nr:serine/threonine-protein kinase [Nocardioides sp.]
MENPTLLNDRYRVGSRVGSGGMADVHRATDELLGREVAVKLLRAGDTRRFATEACTAAALNHPGIVTVLDARLDEERPYLVMELIDGPNLAQEIAEGPLDPERVRAIGRQLAEALAHAHAQGVIHRDVKPANVLLRADGTACLADFGIARTADGPATDTATGMVVGSPAYIAPEQVAGEAVGPAADVYSLGLVLLEALTGRRAFNGTGVEVAYARVHSAPIIPVSLGPRWVSALAAMTARMPQDRPAAAEVGRLLSGPEAAPDAAPDAAPEVVTSAFQVVAAQRRRRVAWAAVTTAAALVSMLLLIGVVEGGTDRAPAVPQAGATSTTTPVAHQVHRPSPTVHATHRAVVARRTSAPAPRPAAHRVTKKQHGKGHHKHGHR